MTRDEIKAALERLVEIFAKERATDAEEVEAIRLLLDAGGALVIGFAEDVRRIADALEHGSITVRSV